MKLIELIIKITQTIDIKKLGASKIYLKKTYQVISMGINEAYTEVVDHRGCNHEVR